MSKPSNLENYTFHDDCNAPPAENIPLEVRLVGFPDTDDNIEEIPALSADGEVLMTCYPKVEGEAAYGVHAMKHKHIALFLRLTSQQAREMAIGLVNMARDLEKHNGEKLVS